MTDLSIIIVNHNNERFLKDCLSSACNGTRRIKFEIIFVDNHSTDGSVELVERDFPQARTIKNQQNLGFCKANNQGLKVYQGRYALLLNTDTVTKHGALDRLVEFMDANPKIGACGPLLLNPDGTPQHQGGLLNRKFWLSKDALAVDYLIGACLMVRREVIDRVGGLDENFFFSNDDLDWCRRIRKAGWPVYFFPQAQVVHYGGYTIKLFNQRAFVEGFRGGLYFCKKHYGSLTYQLYRGLLALFLLPVVMSLALSYPFLKNKKKLTAFWQILKIALTGNIYPDYGYARILLVSNGHAEDLTAATIGAQLRQLKPEIALKALPLVGMGKAYDQNDIENLGIKKLTPSGGFAKEGFRYLLRDIMAGLLGSLLQQVMILRQEAKRTDLVLVMGDVFLVALCGLFTGKPVIFIDGPNSVRIKEYFAIERWILRKFCQKIIVQDKETADYLETKGLPGLYLGTWVMDYVKVTGENFGLAKDKTVIGILPGTRQEAYANLGLILEVFDHMYQSDSKLTSLIASTLERKKIKIKGWELSGNTLRSKTGATALIVEGKFGDVCARSKLIIGLAGIANEQAVGLGTPVVCFPGRGPQTTLRRWQEIHNITGDSMAILCGNAEELAQKTLAILKDPQRLKKMEQIGRESKKDRGAIGRIAGLISEQIK